ncbi:MAG: uracil-DNA glycosylase [Bacteroidetes bacterium]|nr:uracil-DNA glycosylase [Bacteroidota bacterium]
MQRIVSQAQALIESQAIFGTTLYSLPTVTEITLQKSVVADWQTRTNLSDLEKAIRSCMECPLGATRTNFVFGSGNPNADIMIIGEAPGADEDEQGLPFVGAAGQLLTKILASVNFNRDEVYIANILKCRPPGNRRPEKSETDKCEPYLHRQIEIIRPKFILALGLTAANTLLKSPHKMGDIRGKVFNYRGVEMLITYHPAALLRNPNWKVHVWEDVKLLRKMYDAWKNNGENSVS